MTIQTYSPSSVPIPNDPSNGRNVNRIPMYARRSMLLIISVTIL